MPELDADFEISTNNLEAEYEIAQSEHFDCSFEIFVSGTVWGAITGNIQNQEDLQEQFSTKADTSTVETLSETVENNYTELDGKITDESDSRTQADADLQSNIDDVADDLSIETDNRQTADADLQDNIDTVDGKINTHIADKTNPHEVTKTQVGLGNVDNTSDLNKPISTATQTALNGKQDTINDLSDIRTNASNGQSAYNTIQTYGDIVTYDASSFATSTQGQKADTALQPNDNITELNNNAGYITSASLPTVNNNKITIQKNSTDAGSFTLNQSSDKTINISVPTQASDINAVPTSRKINNKPLSSDITLTASDVNALSSSTTINDLTTSAQQDALNSGATSTNIGQIATNTQNITNEVTNRQNADNNLQSQIDAIVASSDVFDIVGTYAELQAYDISTVPVNDIIKVLVDSTHSNAATYYRCVENNNVKSWSYIGSEGAYYTKSEADSLFVEQTTTVNGKALSNNITLTASDVGALPDNTVIPTVNNGTLTIQQNGTDVQTFDANQSSNVTANITVPTDTNDLTNGAGFITGITSSDVTAALGYTPYDDSNPNGYTSNVGTVTSVNNTQPDANGNVTLAIPTVNDGVLTITQNGTSKGTFSANQSSNDTIALTDTTYSNFTGADGTNAGSSGLVPAPSATDNDKYLKGDGTWASVSSGSSTDVQINGTSITSGGVANILTNSAYNSSSNKIATMSDLPSTSGFEQTSNKVTSISSSSTDTQYPSAKSVLNLLKTIYPVGSVYISTTSTCPLASLFGTWTLVSSGKALWTGNGTSGSGTMGHAYYDNAPANTTIAAGLPNIKGKIQGETPTLSGAFTLSSSFTTKNTVGSTGSGAPTRGEISFNAFNSNSIYSDSVTTVQPPAYVVNVWRRTA